MARTTKTKTVSKEVMNVKNGGVVKSKVAQRKKTTVKVDKTVKAISIPKAKVGSYSEEKFNCHNCEIPIPR